MGGLKHILLFKKIIKSTMFKNKGEQHTFKLVIRH